MEGAHGVCTDQVHLRDRGMRTRGWQSSIKGRCAGDWVKKEGEGGGGHKASVSDLRGRGGHPFRCY